MADRVVDHAYCAHCEERVEVAIYRGIAGIVLGRCLKCGRSWPWSPRG